MSIVNGLNNWPLRLASNLVCILVLPPTAKVKVA